MKNPAARVAMDKDWAKWRMKQSPKRGTLIDATIPLVGRTLPELKTPQITDDSSAGVTLNMLHSPHTSALVFLTFKALSINGLRDVSEELGRVMAVTRDTSYFCEGTMAESLEHFRRIRRNTSDTHKRIFTKTLGKLESQNGSCTNSNRHSASRLCHK